MIKLLHGDCLELMKDIPDNSIDLILTDPPYKLDNEGGSDKYNTAVQNIGFMSAGFDIKILSEFERVLNQKQMYIFCSNKQISGLLSYFENKRYIVNLLMWHKQNSPPFCNGTWKSDIEFIIHCRKPKTFFKGKSNIKSKLFQSNMLTHKIHPAEKPVDLLEKFLLVSSDINFTVLDPFMGSGSTGVACKNLNRNFIGIEQDETYFNIAKDRIENMEITLF